MANAAASEAIRQSIKAADRVVSSLQDTSNILIGKVEQYYKQIQDSKAIDAVQVNEDIRALIREAGYGDIGAGGYSEAYNETLGIWTEYYDSIMKQDIKYAASVISDLQVLREADYIRYSSITEQLGGILQDQLIKLRYGAQSYAEASAVIRDAVSGYQARYVDTWVRTSLSNFSTQSNTTLARENGIEYFEYMGPDDGKTRPFCGRVLGDIKTEDEWKQTFNDDGDSAWIAKGGWNCRHDIVGVVPEMMDKKTGDTDIKSKYSYTIKDVTIDNAMKNETIQTLDDLTDLYKTNISSSIDVMPLKKRNMNVFAQVSKQKDLALNKNLYTDPKKFKEFIEVMDKRFPKWLVLTDTNAIAKNTAIHEFGHTMYKSDRVRNGFSGLLTEVDAEIAEKGINSSYLKYKHKYNKAQKEAIAKTNNYYEQRKFIQQQGEKEGWFISHYASANKDEFFAESFSAYHTGNKSIYVDDIGKIIEKYFKR